MFHDNISRGSTYIAVVPTIGYWFELNLTNLFGYTKYLTEPEPGQLCFLN